MRVVVRKWGNSAAVRIPASIMAALHLALDHPVDVREEKGRIIIEPMRGEAYDLNSLVAAITDDNRHDVVASDAPRGSETW